MKPLKRKSTRALVTPHNMAPPRTEDQKRADQPTTSGDLQMLAGGKIHTMVKREQPGDLTLVGVELYVIGRDHEGKPLYHHVPIEEWRAYKVCDGCRLTLGAHFVQTYSGAHAIIDAIIGDGTNYRHYHPDCEPTDGEYKFKVEYGAIKRTVFGQPAPVPKSRMV